MKCTYFGKHTVVLHVFLKIGTVRVSYHDYCIALDSLGGLTKEEVKVHVLWGS